MTTTRQESGILVLLDMVDYTPQVEKLGAEKARELSQYLETQLRERAEPRGFHYIKTIGDAALLFGKKPEELIELFLDLFTRNKIPPHLDFSLRLRMVAHHGFFRFDFNDHDRPIEVYGLNAIKEFRIEKFAETWRLVATDPMYRGVQDLLEANHIEHRELREIGPLKGMEILGDSLLHKLIPPQETGKDGRRLHEQYASRRERLREEVRFIPVFGNLYDPIPMAENFIDLTLRVEKSVHSDAGHSAVFGRPHLNRYRRRNAIAIDEDEKGTDESAKSEEETDPDSMPRVGRASKISGDITAEQLLSRFNKGCILGLPGAGKTTILKHFAWQLLEADPNAVILFLNCRDLRPKNFLNRARGKTTQRSSGIDSVLRLLTLSFLHPGREESELDEKELKAIERATEDIRAEWGKGRLTILIDALDEAPTDELKGELIRLARGLFDGINEKLRNLAPDAPSSNRFYLSARSVERERIALQNQTIFDVRPLTQDHMRRMAERFFYDDPDMIRSFDERIWQEPVVQTMGNTPLTALLLLFYFKTFRRFDVRFATYNLLLKFVLYQLWEKIRDHEFERGSYRMSDFFEQVKRPDFLKDHPEIARQIDALASLCFECLFDTQSGEVLRDITKQQILNCLESFLRSEPGGGLTQAEAAEKALVWFNDFLREHLLIAAGYESFKFVHSTMMEFLAGKYVVSMKLNSKGFQEALKKIEQQSEADSLETVPIACGESCKTGAVLLKQLKGQFDSSEANLVFPFRCVAELETAERERLHGLTVKRAIAEAHKEIDKLFPAKKWVYHRLQELLFSEDVAKIRQAQKNFGGLIPLCQETFPSQYLKGWMNAGSEYVDARRELLKVILHKDQYEQLLKVSLSKKMLGAVADLHVSAATMNESLLTLDRPGEAEDKNIEYYRGELEKVHEGWGEALRGFFGSPNLRHSEAVRALTVAPDGKTFVSASDDGTLKLWDVSSGRELRAFTGHQGFVWACGFSPDGRSLVSGSADQTLKLWDVSSGRELRAFTGHQGSVFACGFSPDGRSLISGSDDQTLKLWDVSSGRELRAFTGHQGSVWACGFSPDGRSLISGSDDRTLKLWDVSIGRELRAFTGHQGYVYACGFSPDGGSLVSGSVDQTLKLWDVSSGRELRAFTGHQGLVSACGFSPDGRSLVSGSSDQTLKLWDVSSGRELRAFTGHQGSVCACGFSPDGRSLVSGSDDQTLKLWDVSSGRELRAFTGHQGEVTACGFSPDGRSLVSGSGDQTLKLWDVSSGRELRACTGRQGSVLACGFSPDGESLVSGSADNTLKLWDVSSGRELRAFTGHQGSVCACGFSPDGRSLVSGSDDKTLKLWDVSSGRELCAFTGHQSFVLACGFSPDGRSLVSGSYDQTLKLWDVSSGRELRAFTGHQGSVWACGFSPDGRSLVSGSVDQTLKLWDVSSGRELRAFTGHQGYVRACGFSPDDRLLISTSNDRTIRVWDVATGRELAKVPLTWISSSLSFSRLNPNLICTGNLNGTLTIFDLRALLK